MQASEVFANIREVSAQFASEREVRQRRRELVAVDFARLQDAGFHLTGVPKDQGGVWESVGGSARPICEMLRMLARGDSSVALVCAMHPAMLNFWMATSDAPAPFQRAWEEQRQAIFRQVREGAWWGTMHPSPGAAAISARRERSRDADRLMVAIDLLAIRASGAGRGSHLS